MGKDICVLDVRSDSVTVATGNCTGKGIINFSGMSVEEYEGYFDGEWLNASSLEDAVVKAYTKLPAAKGFDVLYVGVPAAFCDFYADVNVTDISESTVITSRTLGDIAHHGLAAVRRTRDVIQHCALGYKVDGGDIIFNPAGMEGRRLETYMTYISCRSVFRSVIEKLLPAMHIRRAVYIPVMHAQAMTLLDYSYRTSGEVLIDLGYLECGIAGVRGEGLQGLASATTGSAVVAAELTEQLDIDFYSALSLFGQLDLTNEFEQVSFYSVPKNGDVFKYRASQINDIVKSCLREVAYKLNEAITQVADADACKRVFVTGDAFFDIKGAIKYLAKSMGRAVTPLSPNVPRYDKTQYSSLVALMRQAHVAESENGFIGRVINRLRRV